VQTQSATLQHLEKQFWGRALKIADLNADGTLELHEFSLLMKAFGTELSKEEVEALYRRADADNSNDVSEEELASYLVGAHKDGELSKLIKRCPVSGAELTPGDDWGNLIYMSLCMDQGSGHTLQGSGDPAAGEAWMLKMSEWAPQSLGGSMSAGEALDPKGDEGNFSRIIVYDRASHRLVEEQISATLVLAMRNMYQSKMGAVMMATGAYNTLALMSQEEGRHMDSPESLKNIPTFLKSFSGEVDVSEALEPIDSFKCFNEFFYRKLKPEARPIAQPKDMDVVVSAADCRLSAFATVDEATRCWIKGRKFSLKGLLADGSKRVKGDASDTLAPEFEGGSMFIFRLAPQDYHRFHLPVSGTIRCIRHVRGKLYTVNPIAVASTYANVFTQNKRAVVIIDSPQFGPVAVVCIGATMVGSIEFTAEEGKAYSKGDELGYFAFGGSTVITVFARGKIAIDEDLLHNSGKSLETLVKMGVRLGCHPESPHLLSPSFNAHTIAELQSQTQHLAPLHQAMAGAHITDSPGATQGGAGGSQRPLSRQATAIPVHRHLGHEASLEQASSSSDEGDEGDDDFDGDMDEDDRVAAAAAAAAAAAHSRSGAAAGPPAAGPAGPGP
jgi:phosphatidylserine decarboxylase